MIEKEDIIEYLNDAPKKKVKQLTMVIVGILNPDQLQALSTRFKKKIEFEPQTGKKKMTKKEQDYEMPKEKQSFVQKDDNELIDELDLDID